MVRIVAWNIRQGGGARSAGILAAIRAREPDLMVLTEFRNNTVGAEIRKTLDGLGFTHQLVAPALPRTNSVLMAAKSRLVPLSISLGTEAERYVAAE